MGRSFGPWKDALALALLAAMGTCQGTKQSAPTGELERLCDELRQAGREAMGKRRLASERLLGMREPRAHEAIVAAIAGGEDAEHVTQSLLVKLQNPEDPVFGWGAAGGEARARLLPIYADVAVRAVGAFVAAREPQALRSRAERLRSVLLALRPNERRELFAGLLRALDPADRELAVLAAGECRDLGLASDLAKAWRERPELAEPARTALRRLLFVPSLATLADAEARIAECSGETYLELAEKAARGTPSADGPRNSRLAEQVAALRTALVAALLAQPKVDWVAVAQQALADDPPGGLESLREQLRRLAKAPGDAQGRTAFVRELIKRLRTDGDPFRPALLECAALLVAPGETELEAAILPRLVENLESPQPALREAALLGIARHPSAGARPRIVGLLRAALETRDRVIASAALKALTGQGSSVPSEPAEAVAWLEALEGALKAEFLDTKERSQAVAALALRDEAGRGVPGAFALLGRTVTDQALPVWLREQALVQIAAQAQAGSDSARAVGQLVAVLADAEPRLRSQAATLLGKLPAEAWQPVTYAFLRDRFSRETDEDVLKALLECAKLRFSQLTDKEPVLRVLEHALESVTGGSETRPLDGVGALRRALLANGLATLAATRGVPPASWLAAGECLIKLGERGPRPAAAREPARGGERGRGRARPARSDRLARDRGRQEAAGRRELERLAGRGRAGRRRARDARDAEAGRRRAGSDVAARVRSGGARPLGRGRAARAARAGGARAARGGTRAGPRADRRAAGPGRGAGRARLARRR
jgi:hypothetical protein